MRTPTIPPSFARPVRLALAALGLAATTALPLAAAKAPQPVSPGTVSRSAAVETRCPSFQWAGVPGARGYELAVFRLGENGAEPALVARVSVSGDARGFTPSIGNCLEPGGSYAWSIAAATTGELRWSPPLLFDVRAAPRLEELEREIAGARALVAETRGDVLPGALTAPSSGVTRVASAATPTLGNPSLSVDANISLGLASSFFKDGDAFVWDDGASNVALGREALATAGAGENDNTAVGRHAMRDNNAFFSDNRDYHVAVGYQAMTKGYGENTVAIGARSLFNGTTGVRTTAVGFEALHSCPSLPSCIVQTGIVAVGYRALHSLQNGGRNTAVGDRALSGFEVGLDTTAVGALAGHLNTQFGAEHGIFLGSGAYGAASDTKTIRIGGTVGTGAGQQNRTFINGVFGVTTGLADATAVVIDANGQLGTVSSSLLVKQDIQDVGALADRLLDLRPVAFRYKLHAATDPDSPLQFGLIAEEVAEVLPELTLYDQDGKPQGVRYEFLDSLLLAELERRHAELSEQRRLAADRQTALDQQSYDLESLDARLDAVESRARSGSARHAGLE